MTDFIYGEHTPETSCWLTLDMDRNEEATKNNDRPRRNKYWPCHR
jgi:hypothetical protein